MRFLPASLLFCALLLGGSTAGAVGVDTPVCGKDPATGNSTNCPNYPATPARDAQPVGESVAPPVTAPGEAPQPLPAQSEQSPVEAAPVVASTPEPEFKLVAVKSDGFWVHLWVAIKDLADSLVP